MTRLYLILWLISPYLVAQNTYRYQPIAPVLGDDIAIYYNPIYNNVDLNPEKKAIYEQIMQQLQYVMPTYDTVTLRTCDIMGIKSKKSNPVLQQPTPHFLYDAEYLENPLMRFDSVWFKPFNCFASKKLLRGTGFLQKQAITVLHPNKKQLDSLHLQAGTQLNIDEQWLIPPHYETYKRQIVAKPGYIKPILVTSAKLSSKQLKQLLQQNPIRWDEVKFTKIGELQCYLKDKGFYSGEVNNIADANLRKSIVMFQKAYDLPDARYVFEAMKKEGYID